MLNQSAFAFGAVGLVTLLALALGALLVAALERTRGAAAERRSRAALVVAALGFAAFPALFVASTDGLAFLGSERPWPAYGFAAFGLAAATAGPALLAAAVVLPATLALAGRAAAGATPGQVAGRLLAWNTLGALAGALLAPYLLLPALGLWLALVAVGVLYAGARGVARARGARLLAPLPRRRARPRLGARDLARQPARPAAAAHRARRAPARRRAERERPRRGARARRAGACSRWTTTMRSAAARTRCARSARGICRCCCTRAPRRVAFLGSATGSSAAAALAHASVERTTLVELVPGVAAAARAWFAVENRGVYDVACERGRARRRAQLPARDARALRRDRRRPVRAVAGGHGRALRARALRRGARRTSRRAACSASGCRSTSSAKPSSP